MPDRPCRICGVPFDVHMMACPRPECHATRWYEVLGSLECLDTGERVPIRVAGPPEKVPIIASAAAVARALGKSPNTTRFHETISEMLAHYKPIPGRRRAEWIFIDDATHERVRRGVAAEALDVEPT